MHDVMAFISYPTRLLKHQFYINSKNLSWEGFVLFPNLFIQYFFNFILLLSISSQFLTCHVFSRHLIVILASFYISIFINLIGYFFKSYQRMHDLYLKFSFIYMFSSYIWNETKKPNKLQLLIGTNIIFF